MTPNATSASAASREFPPASSTGFDYTALGHLHGRHTLTQTIRYSGSPLAYSFSETGQVKGSWLVDLGPSGVTSAEFVEAPLPRPLARIRGTLDELLEDTRFGFAEPAWVQATLTDEVRPGQPMERLNRRFPHALALSFEPASGARVRLPDAAAVSGRSDHEIALDFVTAMRGAPAGEAESALLLEATEACCDDRELDLSEVAG